MILVVCNWNLNMPNGIQIFEQILSQVVEKDQLKDLVDLVAKLTQRYLFQRSHLDRDVRPNP